MSIGVGIWGWLDVRSLIEEHGGATCLLRVGLRLRPALVGVALALSLLLALILARVANPGTALGESGVRAVRRSPSAARVGRRARQ